MEENQQVFEPMSSSLDKLRIKLNLKRKNKFEMSRLLVSSVLAASAVAQSGLDQSKFRFKIFFSFRSSSSTSDL